jgi:hypothetical protein
VALAYALAISLPTPLAETALPVMSKASVRVMALAACFASA